MENLALVPTPDTIPAPAWLFLVLDLVTFTIHLLFMNVAVGGTLIMLFSRLKQDSLKLEDRLHGPIAGKVPTTFALAINFGVAPLLFIQVIYGHLFYSSSVFMAVYWILIIPLLILAYYGAYIHIRKYQASPWLSKSALLISALILLYVAFIFVNNMTLMVQPEKWGAYFGQRNGTLLNLSDPSLLPRYLHFIVASVAVTGLFMAILWTLRKRKGVDNAQTKIVSSLRLFAIATAVQMVIGFWFLLALPKDFMLQFMGQNMYTTILLMLGLLLAIGALVSGFLGKLAPTLGHLFVILVVMVLMRNSLRSLYLERFFSTDSLKLVPQYGVMALFLVIFIAGLVIVAYMLKQAYPGKERRVAQ